jgi:hypothetical protein
MLLAQLITKSIENTIQYILDQPPIFLLFSPKNTLAAQEVQLLVQPLTSSSKKGPHSLSMI